MKYLGSTEKLPVKNFVVGYQNSILIIKVNEMHYLYFGKELYMFRTDLLSIIRSLNVLFTTVGIFHTSYVACLLARSGSDLASRQVT